MKTTKTICFLLLILGGLICLSLLILGRVHTTAHGNQIAAHGDQGGYITPVNPMITYAPVVAGEESFRTNINPALLYYQSFLLAPEPMSDADWNYFYSKNGRSQNLPERFGSMVAVYDNQFRLLRQAAHSTVPCDWGIDLSAGPETLLPHLSRVKAAALAAQLRAVWELQHGQQDEASEDLTAAFALARNASRDDTLVGALVNVACEAITFSTVAQNFGEFSPDALQQLSDGFAAAPPRTMASAIQTDRPAICGWMLNRIQELQQANPNDDPKVMEEIQGWFSGGLIENNTNYWAQVLAASGGTSEGVARLIRETEAISPRFAELPAPSEPDYATRTSRLLADIEKSQNPISIHFARDYGFALARECRAQVQEAMVQAAIEYKLHGEAGLDSVRDPFGNGPFQYQRFVFKGVDRGFELKSAYTGLRYPCVLIFVEKPGPPFLTDGPHAGRAITQ